jgi:hypothetical protein
VSTAAPPAPTQSRPTTNEVAGGWRRDWSESFGPHWPLDLAIMGLVVFCFGAIQPLADPDLPMHLSVGEWIVRHRAVPFFEPFSWTRKGAEYYAYSWLPETLYYLVFRTFGHLGLRILQGLQVAMSALAMLVLARAAGWRASHAVILAGINLIVGAFFVAFLRPQSVLLITFPLLWAGVFYLLQGRMARAAILLFLASALTANSHLFFPLTIAPVALLWPDDAAWARARDTLVATSSVLLGWVTSPYARHWPAVFRHNFGESALVRPPSAITELQPGFVSMLHPAKPLLILVAGMLVLPWVLGEARLRTKERLLFALYWCIGVVLFGFATRLFVAWWVLSLVPVGLTLVYLTRDVREGAPRARYRALLLLAAVVVVSVKAWSTADLWALEGSTVSRTLPTYAARPAERLARTLLDGTVGGARGNLLTTFTFGSYLTWRLPGYSASIDSRGIFPDSVAGAEAFVLASDRQIPIGPWRSADVAIVPLRFRVAGVLDTASGWRRVATTRDEEVPSDSVGLWVTTTWWQRNGKTGGVGEPR